MYMKIEQGDFIDMVQAEDRKKFSYEGLQALFDYLESKNPNMNFHPYYIVRDYDEFTMEEFNRKFNEFYPYEQFMADEYGIHDESSLRYLEQDSNYFFTLMHEVEGTYELIFVGESYVGENADYRVIVRMR